MHSRLATTRERTREHTGTCEHTWLPVPTWPETSVSFSSSHSHYTTLSPQTPLVVGWAQMLKVPSDTWVASKKEGGDTYALVSKYPPTTPQTLHCTPGAFRTRHPTCTPNRATHPPHPSINPPSSLHSPVAHTCWAGRGVGGGKGREGESHMARRGRAKPHGSGRGRAGKIDCGVH
jgi:hypothetical protein